MHPFDSPEVRGRVLLFTAPFALAAVLVVAGTVEVTTGYALTGLGLIAVAIAAGALAPWSRLPATARIVPPLLSLAAIAALIGGHVTPWASPLEILVVGPVLWLALYHDPGDVWAGVAGAGGAIVAGGALAGHEASTVLAAAVLAVAVCSVLAVTTIRLREADRRQAAATAAERDQHRLVLGHLTDTMITHMDRDLRWVSVDGHTTSVPKELLLGRTYDEVVPATPDDRLRAAYLAALAGTETRLVHVVEETGRAYTIDVLPERTTGGAISVSRDITEERAAAQRLEASEREHRLLTESARDMISRHDRNGVFLYVSAACRSLFGYEPEEMLGRPARDFTVEEDAAQLDEGGQRLFAVGFATIEFHIRRKDGELVWVEQRARMVGDEIYSTVRDVTERRDTERRLAHLATHDDLTGLWNRRRFNEALREELARAHRHGPDAVMLLIDLDAFKAVNDTHGHATGDRLLVATADAIRSRMREVDAAGRLGGDEFAVLLRGTGAERAEHLAGIYAAAIEAASITLDGGGTLSPRASAGWAVVTADASDEQKVLADADASMYRQKAQRRGSAEG